ncbi:MAG: FtsQ-type POTRA domain-containing protein [Bryobacteraceae bacterium]|nr:FtsQ-type POTRA domain-containing protein [Bryobacteraceae bacterium]
MARKTQPPPKRFEGLRSKLKLAGAVMAIVAGAFGGLLAFSAFEQFMIRDRRFAIAQPVDYGEESPNIRVDGLKHAPRERVRRVFSRDIGRSLFLFPVAERRRNLLAVDWVKDASVQRVWPNRVFVQVTERQPVAFVPIASTGDGAQRFALIDADAEILNLPEKAVFQLPVLLGIEPSLPEAQRRERLRRVMRMITEIGPLTEKISEIDATNPDSLRVTMEVEGRAVVLILGNEHFLIRLKNFLDHFKEVRERRPDATTFDLRLEDRITAIDASERHQNKGATLEQ